jgi:nickel-type superoxide dismutase maturation protease
MAPTLRNGDWWLVRRGARMRTGDVALIVHPLRPDALIVKRLGSRDDDGWWVEGDNPAESEDSRSFGRVPEVNVLGRLALRYRPVWRR